MLAIALTNGSNTTEQFHFYDELDSNAGKTGSARLSIKLPLSIEIGVSGSAGPQDRATDTGHWMWFYGVDLMGHWGRFDLKGQWMQGHADGEPSQGVYGLDLNNGGYLELDAMLTPSLGVLGRGEFRDAFVWLDTQRAYLTKVVARHVGAALGAHAACGGQGRVPHERRIRRHPADRRRRVHDQPCHGLLTRRRDMDQNPKLRTGGSRCR